MHNTYRTLFILGSAGFLAALGLHLVTLTNTGDVEVIKGLVALLILGLFPIFAVTFIVFVSHLKNIQSATGADGFMAILYALKLDRPAVIGSIAVFGILFFYVDLLSGTHPGNLLKLEDGRMVAKIRDKIVLEYKTEEEFNQALRQKNRFMSSYPLLFYLVPTLLSFRLWQITSQELKAKEST